MGSIIAKNYGEALLNIAEENNSLKDYKKDLHELMEVVHKNQELLRVMGFPWISKRDKKEILRSIFNFDQYIMNFIGLLIDNNRFSYIEEICEEFIDGANERLNIQIAEITSAVELTRGEIKDIKRLLEKQLGTNIEIRTIIDSSYIAGIRLKIKDKVFDNTVISKLNTIKERVAAVAL